MPRLTQGFEKVRNFQRKLYVKAKQEKNFKFYSLFDKIYRKDVLQYAWRQCRANKGAPGVDGQTFKTIEDAIGVETFLAEIAAELSNGTYRPQPVRRVYIPKPDGRQRPLGIPVIKDRVVQMACLIIIQPVFEADFQDCSYGFRPKRSAHQAINAIISHVKQGFTAVYDADLSQCFDNISHQLIMDTLSERIVDGKILRLIKGWLTAPIVETGGPRQGKKNRVGTPQGGVISPLLANIVLNKLDTAWYRPDGPRAKYNARLVRYADDFVVLARYIGQPIRDEIENIISSLGLQLNGKKTRILNLSASDTLNFLGYNIKLGSGKRTYLKPGDKAISRLRQRIREIISRKRLYHGIDGIINDINPVLRGWKQYFHLSNVNRIYWNLDFYITARFYRVGRKTSQRLSKIFKPGVFATLKRKGLYSLALD
ncbi:group II intron reverse transcriptase/maturase [Desulfotomaculum copahuensis]|uniref:Group II intron reverse transcriptase/maturase n=1 Tax=Desulfotomaculum copahuensis TaxID=1838280 RepID=A0A1B7LK48_9FIRM|nr:group II intron reverse transcriptase/maturase [Desulfotomaculum copahuensis]OAT86842.1 group II intron reverse transcriptase/maturase [Desulfotomaculum copahuensis]